MPVVTDPICWIVWSLCLFTGISLVLLDLRSRLSWVAPPRWFEIAYFLLYVIPSFNLLYFGPARTMFYSRGNISMTVASVIGGWAFWFGWYLMWRRTKSRPTRPGPPQVSPTFYTLQAMLLLSVALIALIMVFRAYGGMLGVIALPQKAYGLIGSDLYNIFSLMFAAFVPLVAICLGLVLYSKGWYKLLWSSGGVILFLLYVMIGVKLGARYRLLFTIMGCFAVYVSTLRIKRVSSISHLSVLLIFMGVGIFFYILRLIRYQMVLLPGTMYERMVYYFTSLKHGLYYDVFMCGDFDAFENGVALFHLVPKFYPFMWGSTLCSVLYNPIPRIVWPGKPAPSINQPLIEFGIGPAALGQRNFAVSLIAELYGNLGWIGVIVGMLALGIIAGKLWRWFLLNDKRLEAWLHIGLFSAYLPLVMRGSFHCMTVYYLMIVVNELLTRKVVGFIKVASLVKRKAEQ